MAARLIYITCSSVDEATALARDLVGERLAACANILPAVTSVFHWDGAVQEEPETVLILKTREDLVDALTERVRARHSYDCPCVVALAIDGGNPGFLDWIAEETRAA